MMSRLGTPIRPSVTCTESDAFATSTVDGVTAFQQLGLMSVARPPGPFE